MKFTLILTVLVVLSVGVLASCSRPATGAYTPPSGGSTVDQASSNVVDITAQGASAIPTSAVKKAEPAPVLLNKNTVSPGNLPKCVDQFAATQKVWEKMKTANQYYGTQKYMYELGDRCYLNGNPLHDMNAAVTPIPLLVTWDTKNVKGVNDVKSWGSHATMVRVEGRRRGAEGNWYNVVLVKGGIEQMKGWVPEKLISSNKSVPTGGWGGITAASCGGGSGGG